MSLKLLFLMQTALLFLLSPISIFCEEKEIHYTGIAKDRHGTELYKEIHHLYFEGDKLIHSKTEMFDTKGELITVITSDYSRSRELPDYHVNNIQSGEEENLQVKGEEAIVQFRSLKGETLQTKSIPIEPSLISGFGVNFYIQDHLDVIAAGEAQHVKLLAVPRLNVYPMKFEKTDVKGFEGDSEKIGISLKIDLSLFSMIFPSAEFVIEKKTKKILFYRGPSNVVYKNGFRPEVYIYYSLPTE